jgi:hypothetical protein
LAPWCDYKVIAPSKGRTAVSFLFHGCGTQMSMALLNVLFVDHGGRQCDPKEGDRMSQKIANKGDGNQIAQFGGDLNGTLNQINGTRTLASLTLPELGEEYLLADSIVSRERKSRLKTAAIAALACLLCIGITFVMYRLFGQPSLREIVFRPTEGSKLELSMNLTLAIPVVAAALSGAGAYGKVINPSELEVDRQQHRRNAYMVARQRGLTERDWYEVVEAAKQH